MIASIVSGNGSYTIEQVQGLDVFSLDGELVGRIRGFLDPAPVNVQGLERAFVDGGTPADETLAPHRLLVDGTGFVLQAELSVLPDQIAIDLRGRRATLPLTLAQLEAIERHDPLEPLRARS